MPTYVKNRLELTTVVVSWAALLVVACGGSRGAEPAEVREHLDEVVVPMIDDSATAFDALESSQALADLELALGNSGISFGQTDDLEGVEPEPEEPEVEDPNEPTAGEQMAQFLRDRIFTDDNYEGDGVYRIRGSDVCPETVSMDPGVPGEPEPEPVTEVDPDCVRMIDEAELRLQVILRDDGIDVTLLVGPRRAKPVRLESRDDRFTVVSDLGAAKAAIEHIAQVTETEVEMPDVFEGVVAATLRREGPEAASLSFAVREPVAVAVDTEDGRVSVEVAASDPMVRLALDASVPRIELGLDAGRILAEMPWGLYADDDESTIEGTLKVDLAGASGTVVLDDDARSVSFEGVGLGDATSTVKLDDEVIWSFDLNADSGRTFDLEMSPGDGSSTLTFQPGVHVVTTIDTRPITESWDEIDPAADGDTYEVTLEGDAPTIESIDGGDTGADVVRVVSGRLTLEATGVDPIVVEAGQCLLESELEGGDGSAFGDVHAGACP